MQIPRSVPIVHIDDYTNFVYKITEYYYESGFRLVLSRAIREDYDMDYPIWEQYRTVEYSTELNANIKPQIKEWKSAYDVVEINQGFRYV